MKVSGRVVSTKPISLSRAAKLISRFAAVENGSSPAVSLYLQRTSDAFNHLVQFHAKPKNLQSLHTENESENVSTKSEKKIVNNLDVDGATKKEKKKKEKRKRGEAEKSGSKKSRAEAIDS